MQDDKDRDNPTGDEPTSLAAAADQIRQGGRMLVREVKVLDPAAVELDSEMLLAQVEEAAREIEEGNLAGADDCLGRCLAPLLAGPGYPRRRYRRRLLVLWVSLVALAITAILTALV